MCMCVRVAQKGMRELLAAAVPVSVHVCVRLLMLLVAASLGPKTERKENREREIDGKRGRKEKSKN